MNTEWLAALPSKDLLDLRILLEDSLLYVEMLVGELPIAGGIARLADLKKAAISAEKLRWWPPGLPGNERIVSSKEGGAE